MNPWAPRCHWLRFLVAVIGLGMSVDSAHGAPADPYPSHPIRLVVPYAPGGVSDTLARVVGEKLEAVFGQSVVVENRPGASGNIASEFVARAVPDGCTLLVGASSVTILPSTLGEQALDPVRALVPITKLVTQPILIAINPTLPVRSLAELVVLARSVPGGMAYGTAGIGTTDHLSAALLWTRANVEAVHVPYANTGQELKDLLHGDIKVSFITLGAVATQLHSGQLKALAVTSRTRVAAFPDVPTVAESGFPGFEVMSWYGLLAPAGTPREIVDRLHREVVRILRLPDVREKLLAMGAELVGNTPEQFADEISMLLKFWPPIVRAAGITSQ